MRVVGVPVVDADPVELRSEVPLGVRHQLAREGADILQFGGVFRRDDEPEMMPVILAALGEGFRVGIVRRRVEHPRVRPISRHALALEIGHMFGQRRRAKRFAL